MIESLKYLLESMSSSIEKCTRLIPEFCLMSDHAHVSSHCENKSRSVCMKAVSTMTNPPALHVFTNHDDSTTKPADVLSNYFFKFTSRIAANLVKEGQVCCVHASARYADTVIFLFTAPSRCKTNFMLQRTGWSAYVTILTLSVISLSPRMKN